MPRASPRAGGRGASDGGPADHGRALRRGRADDDSASHRGPAGDRDGGRRAGGDRSDRPGVGGARKMVAAINSPATSERRICLLLWLPPGGIGPLTRHVMPAKAGIP